MDPIHRQISRRICVGVAVLLIASCAGYRQAYTADRFDLDTSVGIVEVTVDGFVGGLTNARVTQLVAAGVRGTRRSSAWTALATSQPLSMHLTVTSGGARPPITIITATLSAVGRKVVAVYDRVPPPNINPDAVFISNVHSLTLRLLEKARNVH